MNVKAWPEPYPALTRSGMRVGHFISCEKTFLDDSDFQPSV